MSTVQKALSEGKKCISCGKTHHDYGGTVLQFPKGIWIIGLVCNNCGADNGDYAIPDGGPAQKTRCGDGITKLGNRMPELLALDNADLSLVVIGKFDTPHCKRHGAMNAISRYFRDGKKFLIWRCVSTYESNSVVQDLTKRRPQIKGIRENACLAGCVTEVREK